MGASLRKLGEMAAMAAIFSATVLLVHSLADADSLPRRLLHEWVDAIRDRRAFAETVRSTIDQLPTRKGEQ